MSQSLRLNPFQDRQSVPPLSEGIPALPEILHQHQVAAGLIELAVEDSSFVGRDSDALIHPPCDDHEFARLARGELVETEVATSLCVRCAKEVDSLPRDGPPTERMQ